MVEQWLDDGNSLSGNVRDITRLGLLACMAPALMVLSDDELLKKMQDFLISTNADKNDGLGATIKVFALFLLSN